MKKIFRLAAFITAAASLFSCQELQTEEDSNLNKDIQFTIQLSEVTQTSAKFKVKHDGVKADTWYYLATTESDINKAIQETVAACIEEGVSLVTSTSKTISIRNLEAETDYTFVVFGLSKEGKVYGEPATMEFKTARIPVYELNDAWTVEYIGDYKDENGKYENVVIVQSTDENTYFTTAWPKDLYEQYGIKYIAESEVAGWIEYLPTIGKTFNEILLKGSTLSIVDINTQYGFEWYVIAIGADANGFPTGYYAVSELVSLIEEDPTEEYSAWLGDWTLTGANGKTQNVTFSKDKSNKTFIMTGYEGEVADKLDVGVVVDWIQEEACWIIYNQNFGTYNFGNEYGLGDIWFVGEGTTEDIYLEEQFPICAGGTLEDGTKIAYGHKGPVENEDGTTSTYEVTVMEYVVDLFEIGSLSYLTNTFEDPGYPTFPITFTRAAKSVPCSVPEFKGSRKNVKAVKDFNLHEMKTANVKR